MLSPWHLIVISALLYVAHVGFAWQRLELPALRRIRLGFVNAAVFVCLTLFGFAFLLQLSRCAVPPGLWLAAMLSLSVTAWIILRSIGLSQTTRTITQFVIIVTVAVLLFRVDGFAGFTGDVDAFIHTAAGDGGALGPSAVEESEGRLDTARRQGLTASRLLRGAFVFTFSFLFLYYYGHVWRIRHEAKIAKEHSRTLATEAVDQIVLVLSVAASLWLAFIGIGADILSLSVFTGLVAMGASVALRDLLTNFVAGMLLLWEKSIKLGDVIAFEGKRGVVDRITMRYIVAQDRDDISHLIPHAQLLNSRIENWTKSSREVRVRLDVGVAYGTPLRRVKEILKSVCFDVERVLQDPLPNPLLIRLGESAIEFQLRFKIRDPERGVRNVMSEVYELVLERFEREGIVVPFPRRDVRLVQEQVEPKDERRQLLLL